jgi:LysM repeat protein
MERICPFLALQADGHNVVAGYDPEHRCGALLPHEPIDRIRQIATCLDAAHAACPRYQAAMQVRDEQMPWAPPSPDSDLVTTRLVLAPDSVRQSLVSAGARARTRRWAIGAALAVVGVVAVAGGVLGALGSLRLPDEAAMVSTSPGATPTRVPAIGGRPLAATPETTPETSPPPTATPRPTRSPRASADPSEGAPAEQGTYVVQEGDTLGDIANRFGTTIAALESANGLRDTDVIVIGQELVIP